MAYSEVRQDSQGKFHVIGAEISDLVFVSRDAINRAFCSGVNEAITKLQHHVDEAQCALTDGLEAIAALRAA